jgi:hypothetical protein
MTTHPFAPIDRPRSSAGRRAARHRPDDPIHLLAVPVRQLRLEVLLWAMRMGLPVDADTLTCVLLAQQSTCDGSVLRFTAESVRGLLWVDILSVCADLERRPPDDVATTMWTLFEFLDRHDRFDDHSDPIEALREPLVDSGGLARRRGRVRSTRTRHPAAR